MEKLLQQWYASQNEATKLLLRKVVERKVKSAERVFSFVEI